MRNLKEVKYVYHATIQKYEDSIKQEIETNLPHASRNLDFGKGFYTTTNLLQAQERAYEVAKKEAKKTKTDIVGIVIRFNVNVSTLYTVKEHKLFENQVDSAWARFIANNRYKKHVFSHNYSWTYGLMADGTELLRDVNLYMEKNIALEDFLKRIKPYKATYDQLVFHNKKIANTALTEATIIYKVDYKYDSRTRRR